MSDLVHRLRGKYPVGPIMENGEPEFGWRDTRGPAPEGMMLPSPIELEAAKEIERLQREVARLQKNEDIQTMLLMCFCEALELTPDDIKAPAAAAKALVLDAPSPYAPNDNVAHTPAISAIVATLRSRIAEAKAKEAP